MSRANRLRGVGAFAAVLCAVPAAMAGAAEIRKVGAPSAGPMAVTVPAEAARGSGEPIPESRGGGGGRAELAVTVDRAKVIRLPERTQTVVIGNPSIADLSIQKNGIVIVTGKSYGVTNLIALDSAGGMLAESTVSVAAPTDAIVTVQRGLERQSYSCTPSCQPSVLLGDSNTFFSENRGQAEQRNQFAVSR